MLESLFRKRALGDPIHLRKWASRFNNSPTSQRYLRNTQISAEFFCNIILSGGVRTFSDYLELLRQLHLLTTKNLNSVAIADYDPQSKFPEFFVFELFKLGGEKAKFASGTIQFDKPLQQNVSTQVNLHIRQQPTPSKIKLHLGFDGQIYRPEICIRKTRTGAPWFRSSCGRKLIVTPGGCFALNPISLSFNLALLKKSFRAFCKAIQNLGATNNQHFVKLLANYYKCLAVAHPFISQNNSVAMNQINCLLFLTQDCYVPHGVLDDMAFFLEEEDFARLFERYVRRHAIPAKFQG